MKVFGFVLTILAILTAAVPESRAQWSQPAEESMTVTGTVSDADGNPLSGVTVRVNDYYFVNATTDNYGYFNLTVNPSSIGSATNSEVDTTQLKLTANIDGYYPQTKPLEYVTGASANAIFELSTLPYSAQSTANQSGNTYESTNEDEESSEPVGSVVEPSAN